MKGCMLIHGFTGSPYEVEPLANYLQQHTDWKIYTPTLAGHGSQSSLKETTYEDWISSAEEALQQASDECDELYLIGFSMGGLIASYLATRYPVSRLVLLSTAVFYPNTQQFLKEMREIARTYFHNQELAQSNIDLITSKWKNTPIHAVIQFRRLVKHLKPKLKDIDIPVLIIHGKKDQVVKPKSAEYIYNMVQSANKELVWLEESKHRVCHDCEKDFIFRKVEEFLAEKVNVY